MHSFSDASRNVKTALAYCTHTPGSTEWQAAAQKAFGLLVHAAAQENRPPNRDDDRLNSVKSLGSYDEHSQ
jgi:hypothetical protein